MHVGLVWCLSHDITARYTVLSQCIRNDVEESLPLCLVVQYHVTDNVTLKVLPPPALRLRHQRLQPWSWGGRKIQKALGRSGRHNAKTPFLLTSDSRLVKMKTTMKKRFFYSALLLIILCASLEALLPTGEVFPLYSWNIFSERRLRKKIYVMRVVEWKGVRLSRPVLFHELNQLAPGSLTHEGVKNLFSQTRELKLAFAAKNEGKLRQVQDELRRLLQAGLPYEIQFVHLKSDPLVLWRMGQAKRVKWLMQWREK